MRDYKGEVENLEKSREKEKPEVLWNSQFH